MKTHRLATFLLALALAGALVLYVPWQDRPFDVLDFSEFLPLLREHRGFWDRLTALVDYYARQHGRFNILPYAALALKWTALGAHPVLWQLLRFLQMALATVGVWWLLSDLTGSRTAAAFASGLFVVGGTATGAWVRLTMAEPLGLLFLVAASLLAARYQANPRWKSAAWEIALLLGCAILTKEMFLAGVPFVLLIALCRRPTGLFDKPAIKPRGTLLAGAIGSAVLITGIPIALFALQARASGFSSLYAGASGQPTAHVVAALLTFALPHSAVFSDSVVPFLVTNYFFVAVIALGCAVGARRPERRRSLAWLLTAAAVLPLFGTIAYSPWPFLQQFYGLPFLVGPALALAATIAEVETGAPRYRGLAYGASMLVLVGSGLSAHRQARYAVAEQEVNVALAEVLSRSSAGDSVLVAVREPPLLPWIGRGPTLRRYAGAQFRAESLPPAADVTCAELADRDRRAAHPATIVSLNVTCGALVRSDLTVLRRFEFVRWPPPELVNDSIRADIEFALPPP